MSFLKNRVIARRCVAFLLSISLVSVTMAQPDSVANYPPLGQLVDIGGWKLHLYGQGTRQPQGPTVILESGIGGFSFDWSLVQPKIATFTRVYSYDRAGSAWSELGPRPHTMQQAVYELYTLLKQAQVPGPYVLVGASYGGVLVRLFAQHYPKEVAGMVLVDSGVESLPLFVNGQFVRPSDVNRQPIPAVKRSATIADNQLAQTPEARKLIGDVLGKAGIDLAHPKLNPTYKPLPEFARQRRLWATSRYEYYAANDNPHHLDELAVMMEYRKNHPQFLGSIPLVVLTRGKREGAESDAQEQERKQAQAALTTLSSNSKQLIASQSGHHIQIDDPELVVKSIREAVESIRTGKPLSH